MIDVLSKRGAAAIAEAAARRALLAFDFDGTLAPIVADRGEAQMRESTRVLLRTAARVYPTAIISGRARGDVAARLHDVPLLAIVGNHGAEASAAPADPDIRGRVEGWAAALRRTLAGVGGVDVEDKGLTLAVHYRHARSPAEASGRIFAAASSLPRARVTGGHAVVNVCPVEMPSKGAALEDLARRVAAPMVVYVGDDVTDEDAFASACVDISVRVGRSPGSAARYWVARQADVDAFLEALIAARARHVRGDPNSVAELGGDT